MIRDLRRLSAKTTRPTALLLLAGNIALALLLAGCSGRPGKIASNLGLPQPTRLAGIALGDSEEDVRALYGDRVTTSRFDSHVRSIVTGDALGSRVIVWLSDVEPRVIKVQLTVGAAPWKALQAARQVYGEPDIEAPLWQWALWSRKDAAVTFEAASVPGDMVAGLPSASRTRKGLEDAIRLPSITLSPPGASIAAGMDKVLAAIRGPRRKVEK